MPGFWSAASLSLLCLTTHFSSGVTAIKATSLVLKPNQHNDFQARIVKKDYLSTTFKTNNETVFGFFVDVLVGTPPQLFSLAFSTSSTTWVPAPPELNATTFCNTTASGSSFWSCYYDQFFNYNASSTFTMLEGNWSNSYGTGLFAMGDYGQDDFKINQVTIENVSFGLASNWSKEAEIGLGVNNNRRINPHLSVPEMMAEQDSINSVLYSIYVNDIRNDGGEIFFGAVDEAKYTGNLKTFNSEVTGEVPVNGVHFIAPDGTNTTLVERTETGKLGEIQLGTPSLWVPNVVYRGIINSIPALDYNTAYEAYTVDCQTPDEDLGVLQIDIGGVMIDIPGRQMMVEYPAGSNLCVLTVYQQQSGSFSTDYVLGTPFVRMAYSVFDWSNNQTSIAPSIQNATGTTIKEVPAGGVSDLEQRPDTSSTPDVTTALPTPTDSPTDEPEPESDGSSTNLGAIIGGSVGGAVALGIGAFLTWFLMKRRRRDQALPPPPAPVSQFPPPPAGGYVAGQNDGYASQRNSQFVPEPYKPVMAATTNPHTYGTHGAGAPPSAYNEATWGSTHERPNSVLSGNTQFSGNQPDYSNFGANANGNPQVHGGAYNYPSDPVPVSAYETSQAQYPYPRN